MGEIQEAIKQMALAYIQAHTAKTWNFAANKLPLHKNVTFHYKLYCKNKCLKYLMQYMLCRNEIYKKVRNEVQSQIK